MLLEAGANPNSSYIGWQSLNWAICVNYVYGVKQLIKYGADINRRSLEGTPLELALQKNKMEIVEILRGENVHESADSLTATQSIKGAALVDLSETKNISSASPSQKPVDSQAYEARQ